MARKPHLVVMTDTALREYKERLRMEMLAVLVEENLRVELDAIHEREGTVDEDQLPFEFGAP